MLLPPVAIQVVDNELARISKILSKLLTPSAVVAYENADLLVARPPKTKLLRGAACNSRDLGRRQGCNREALDLRP